MKALWVPLLILFAGFTALSFGLVSSTTSSTEISTTVSSVDIIIGQTTVTLEPAAQGMPEEYIIDLVEEYPESGHITIYEWYSAESSVDASTR